MLEARRGSLKRAETRAVTVTEGWKERRKSARAVGVGGGAEEEPREGIKLGIK